MKAILNMVIKMKTNDDEIIDLRLKNTHLIISSDAQQTVIRHQKDTINGLFAIMNVLLGDD